MRGAVKKLSRLSVARACFVTAALLVPVANVYAAPSGQRGSQTTEQGQSSRPENVAYAIPRSEPLDGAEVVLAQPLAPSDVTIYRRIFAAQRVGHIAAAKALIGRLDNPMLLGQVEAQLYLGPHHHSTPAELEAWIAKYGGEPCTGRIRHLLAERLPRGTKLPGTDVAYLPEPRLVASGAAPKAPKGVAVPRYLETRVDNLVAAGNETLAINAIAADGRMSLKAGAALRGVVARHLFGTGRYAEALTVASNAAREGHEAVWEPDFIAGLAAWQSNKVADALPWLAAAATADDASADQRAAGAFWAARVELRLRQPQAYLAWLGIAAGARGSFYGMLADRLLGHGLANDGLGASLSEADVEAVAAQPEGNLAFALIQVGRPAQAALALRALKPVIEKAPGLGRAVMRVAARAGLVDVAVAVDRALPGNEIAGAKLPLPALLPAGGFNVDPSLVYALARTESGFDVGAVSPVGARGLMQLMPATAHAMALRGKIAGSPENPAINLALGQSYLIYLGDQPGVSRSLLDILASYNAGPAAAAGWARSIHDGGDPLVFLESIPNPATRRFVRQVLTDSWIYAEELGSTPKSLDAMAQGRFPLLSPYGADLADR